MKTALNELEVVTNCESSTDRSLQTKSNHEKDDIITIDSIDLRVRGELPQTRILNGATDCMEHRMTKFLECEREKFTLSHRSVLDGRLNFNLRPEKNPAFEEFKEFHFNKFIRLADSREKNSRKNKFLFSIEPGFEIIIPPYDTEWRNSFTSFSSTNKVSGTFKSSPTVNSYGTSGVGVFLSPSNDISARLSAHCPVSYSWSNFINEGGGYAASRGGAGITIYNASLGTLVKDEHEELWSQSKRPSDLEVSGGSDDLAFQSTSLGNSYFQMSAGNIYLVWLWCWAFADSSLNAAAFANIDCKVPFMIVDSIALH